MPHRPTSAAVEGRIRLATLALYGNPDPSEPLECALDRALRRLDLEDEPDEVMTDRLRARVIAGLPGETETEKLDLALADAPDWLLEQGLHH